MKNFSLGFLTGVFVLLLAAAGYLASGLGDVRSDVPIPRWAARMLSSSVHASVRREAPNVQNPLATGDETLIAGGKLYLNDCVGCHGEPGKPASDFGGTFYPPAPQFPVSGTRYQEAQVFWIAKHGIRRTGMAAQGFTYSDKELWSLAAFISHISSLPPRVVVEIQPEPAEGVPTESPK